MGSERRNWVDGKVLVFDTSVLHEAANESPDRDRYVLMLRVWHPQTSEKEREALQFIFDACADPALVESPGSVSQYARLFKERRDYFEGAIAAL